MKPTRTRGGSLGCGRAKAALVEIQSDEYGGGRVERMHSTLLGHLAALELTSTAANRRYANGLRRLGFGPAATLFDDEHVEADAVHEQVALTDLCGAHVAAEPMAAGEVLFGAQCCLALDAAFSATMLRRWTQPRPRQIPA